MTNRTLHSRTLSDWESDICTKIIMKKMKNRNYSKRKRGAHLSHSVDLLVDLRAVVVTLLTGTRDGEADSRRMPRSDTRNLAQTLVRLPGKLLRVPPGRHTYKQTEEPLKSTQTQYIMLVL